MKSIKTQILKSTTPHVAIKDTSNFVGSSLKTYKDIRNICKDLRDTSVETFYIFLLDPSDIIRYVYSITSDEPGTTYAVEGSNKEQRLEFFDKIAGLKEEFNCDSYILVHNHPSGDARPSEEDYVVSQKYEEYLEGYLDHFVVGIQKVFSIDAQLYITFEDADEQVIGDDDLSIDLLPQIVIKFSKNKDNNISYLFYVDDLKYCRAIQYIDLSDFNFTGLYQESRRLAAQTGSPNTVLYTQDEECFNLLLEENNVCYNLFDAFLYKPSQGIIDSLSKHI